MYLVCLIQFGRLASGAESDTTCEACPAGKYSDVADATPCKPHSSCAVGAGVKSAGTPSADTACQTCGAAGTAVENAYSPVDSATEACRPCTKCGLGEGVKVACSSSVDTTCEDCGASPASAAASFYSDVEGSTQCSARRCHSAVSCHLSSFATQILPTTLASMRDSWREDLSDTNTNSNTQH